MVSAQDLWSEKQLACAACRACSERFPSLLHFIHPQPYSVVYYYLHFPDEETKAQKGEVTCPRSHIGERFRWASLLPGSVWPATHM